VLPADRQAYVKELEGDIRFETMPAFPPNATLPWMGVMHAAPGSDPEGVGNDRTKPTVPSIENERAICVRRRGAT